MDYNRLTLTFDGVNRNLEEKFVDHYFKSVLGITRFSLLAGFLLYGVFGVLDAIMLPGLKEKVWFVRYAVICPLILLTFFLSYHPSYKKYWQLSLILVIFSAGLGILYMIAVVPLEVGYRYYVGLILVIFFCYTFFRTRFLYATITCWLLVLVYLTMALWIVPTPTSIIINNNFFFVGANIAGMFACYSIEFHERKKFYLYHLLEEEKKKVRETNQILREKIEELEQASAQIKTLTGMLPICARCKKIRDDQGYWNQLEKYIKEHTDAEFTHGICPDCAKELYSVDISAGSKAKKEK